VNLTAAQAEPNVSAALGDDITLVAWKPQSPAASVGLAVEFLRNMPAFARLQFGEWSQVLISQVSRGHFLFVVDQNRRVVGFLGWALTHPHLAEQWIAGRTGLSNEECREGDCVIISAVAAETSHANRFILKIGRKIFAGKRTIYYKRHYPDGRVRPVRLTLR
jgi:hemolysin-activating ACP:hemolysin acyltransferase